MEVAENLVERLQLRRDEDEGAPLVALLRRAFEAVISLCHELQSRGEGAPLGASASAALLRLQHLSASAAADPSLKHPSGQRRGDWKAPPSPSLPSTSSVALVLCGAVGRDREQLCLLLHRLAVDRPSPGPTASAAAALCRLPLLLNLAYDSDPKIKRWSAHLLGALEETTRSAQPPALSQDASAQSSSSAALAPRWHGGLCLQLQAKALVGGWWPDATGTAVSISVCCQWLSSLSAHLDLIRGLSGEDKERQGGAEGGSVFQVSLAPSSEMRWAAAGSASPSSKAAGVDGAAADGGVGAVGSGVVTALLRHPSAAVRIAAAGALRGLLLLRPPASLKFIPSVLSQLSSSPSTTGVGSSRKASIASVAPAAAAPPVVVSPTLSDTIREASPEDLEAKLAAARAQAALLLSVLPAMAADASVAPFAARVAAPLNGEGSPLLLRCVGLRVTVQGWLMTGGHSCE